MKVMIGKALFCMFFLVIIFSNFVDAQIVSNFNVIINGEEYGDESIDVLIGERLNLDIEFRVEQNLSDVMISAWIEGYRQYGFEDDMPDLIEGNNYGVAYLPSLIFIPEEIQDEQELELHIRIEGNEGNGEKIINLIAYERHGIVGKIGNARIIVDPNVNETIERNITLINDNDVPLTIHLNPWGDLEDYIVILDNDFVLQPGEERNVGFQITAPEMGKFTTFIMVFFTYGEERVVLNSVVIVNSGFEIMHMQNNSIIKGDFTSLYLETNRDAVCEYSINGNDFARMNITGEGFHIQNIEDLEENINYSVNYKCTDSYNNTITASHSFSIDLSELREFMILEDIVDFNYSKSFMLEAPKIDEDETYWFNKSYFAYYNKGDEKIYAVSVMEFENISSIEDYLARTVDIFHLINQRINSQNVYVSNSTLQYTTWINGNFVISVMVFSLEGSDLRPLLLIEEYLKKYPSNIGITDITASIIELINPNNDYEIKTSSSSKTINFDYKVFDESNIDSCSLIIDNNMVFTNTNIIKGAIQTFSKKLDRDSYAWKIICMDSEGNEGNSEVRELIIKKKSHSSSSSNTLLNYNNSFIIPQQLMAQEPLVNYQLPEETKIVELDDKEIVNENKESLSQNNFVGDFTILVISIFNVILFILIIIFYKFSSS